VLQGPHRPEQSRWLTGRPDWPAKAYGQGFLELGYAVVKGALCRPSVALDCRWVAQESSGITALQ
jgi:hypothetical protein